VWVAVDVVARRIAGDIVMSDSPGAAMRKWREIFGFTQSEVAKAMAVAPSVLSDYEKGRRVPGTKFIKKFVEALIRLDEARGFPTVRKLAGNLILFGQAIIDIREFSQPLSVGEVVELVKGVVVSGIVDDRKVYGYTVLDSVRAITSMSGHDFWYLMGFTSERVLVFTRVSLGRSPMVAVRVAPVKPAMIVIHGPRRRVDPLAIILAERERIPLVVSFAESVDEIVESLRSRSI